MPEISQRESRRLIELERVIAKGLDSFMEVGTALLEIQEEKLYLASHRTFELYCNERWSMSVRTAYRRIESVKPPVNEVVNSVCHDDAICTPVVQHKASLNGAAVADPPAIAQARKTGRIPIDAYVEITEPDEPTTLEEIEEDHEQAAAQVEDEMSDEDWCDTLPLAKKLTGYQLKIFRKDAITWRSLDKARESYLYYARRAVKREDKGEFAYRVMTFLSIDAPDKWNLCTSPANGGCGGTGSVGAKNLECTKCRRRGYWIMGRNESA